MAYRPALTSVETGEEGLYGAETEAGDAGGAPHGCGSGHVGVVRDFVEAVWTGHEPKVPAREARVAVDTILLVYESTGTVKRIEL